MPKNKQTSFVKNAAILSFAGIFSRMLGALYRIPLTRMISLEGIGLYTMGYNIYAMLLAISSTGIPGAISKLVSEEVIKNRMGEARRIFRLATTLLTTIGFIVTIGFILAAPLISRLIMEPRSVYSMVAVAPAIFIVALMASVRGFFQGLQMMWPTAISQIAEQLGRVITVLALAWYMISINAKIEYTAASASFGATVGSMIGLIVIIITYIINRSYVNKLTMLNSAISSKTNKQIIKRILVFAIPITIGAMVIPLMNGIDAVLVRWRLIVAGLGSEGTRLYGDLTTNIPLINLPSMLAYALAASLVPAISTASATGRWKEVRQKSRLAIKLILVIGLPAAAGLSILALPITTMLFAEATPASVLEILAFAIVFLTLHQACTGVLQGLGLTYLPVRNLVIGGVVKIILNYILIAIPAINIRGAAISSIIAYAVASLLNVSSVCKHTGLKIEWLDMIFKPLIATGIMSVFTSLCYNSLIGYGIHNSVATLAAIIVGMFFFGTGLLITKCFSEPELNSIPYLGPPIVKIADKLKLL